MEFDSKKDDAALLTAFALCRQAKHICELIEEDLSAAIKLRKESTEPFPNETVDHMHKSLRGLIEAQGGGSSFVADCRRAADEEEVDDGWGPHD